MSADLNTDKLPADLNTEELPADPNADKLPADLNTEELPADLNTEELSTDLNTDNLSVPLNADKKPADLNDLPTDLTTDDHSTVKDSSFNFNSDESCCVNGLPVNFNRNVHCSVNDVCDDIDSDSHHLNLTSIKLPPKIRKRWQPKGLTVIGLPRKKKCIVGPVNFLMKSQVEREKQMLHWMLPDHLIKKVLQNEILECEELSGNSLEFSPNLLNENVNWASV